MRQTWTLVPGVSPETASLSLADGSLLALRDCDAYFGAQFLVGAGAGHCDQIIFTNTTDTEPGSIPTIKLSWPQGNDKKKWCAGINNDIGGGPGVGAWACNEPGTGWTANTVFDNIFALELQEGDQPNTRQRRCLSAGEWGNDDQQ